MQCTFWNKLRCMTHTDLLYAVGPALPYAVSGPDVVSILCQFVHHGLLGRRQFDVAQVHRRWFIPAGELVSDTRTHTNQPVPEHTTSTNTNDTLRGKGSRWKLHIRNHLALAASKHIQTHKHVSIRWSFPHSLGWKLEIFDFLCRSFVRHANMTAQRQESPASDHAHHYIISFIYL